MYYRLEIRSYHERESGAWDAVFGALDEDKGTVMDMADRAISDGWSGARVVTYRRNGTAKVHYVAPTEPNHSATMRREHGEGFTRTQHDMVYSLAYREGHACGESEIETYYVEFADFARKLLTTTRNY